MGLTPLHKPSLAGGYGKMLEIASNREVSSFVGLDSGGEDIPVRLPVSLPALQGYS